MKLTLLNKEYNQRKNPPCGRGIILGRSKKKKKEK